MLNQLFTIESVDSICPSQAREGSVQNSIVEHIVTELIEFAVSATSKQQPSFKSGLELNPASKNLRFLTMGEIAAIEALFQ
jgi:hypothetical protein